MTSNPTYRDYVFSITYHPQEPAYLVDFLDFPDIIITSGSTLPEAFA